MATWDHIKEGDRVEFETHSDKEQPRLEGTVISTWDRPAQLDIKDDQQRVWVRRAQDVIVVARPS